MQGQKLAHPEGVPPNLLMQNLADWNAILRFTSIGQKSLKPDNDGEDGSALRDNRPVDVRRRKTG